MLPRGPPSITRAGSTLKPITPAAATIRAAEFSRTDRGRQAASATRGGSRLRCRRGRYNVRIASRITYFPCQKAVFAESTPAQPTHLALFAMSTVAAELRNYRPACRAEYNATASPSPLDTHGAYAVATISLYPTAPPSRKAKEANAALRPGFPSVDLASPRKGGV